MAKHLFKPGQSGNPKGKAKGTPNKKTKEFMLMLEERGFDPGQAYVDLYFEQMKLFEEFRKLHKTRNLPTAAGFLADASVTLNNICQYVYPKKKAIEHSGEVGVKTFADFMAAAQAGKKKS